LLRAGVLITASGPQALNALVHRERYTPGRRQNRCVRSPEALALRAKAVGNGRASGGWHSAIHRTLYSGQLVCTALVTRDLPHGYPFRGGVKNRLPYATRAAPVHSRRSTKLPTQMGLEYECEVGLRCIYHIIWTGATRRSKFRF
jgi:hypothetical protein